MSKPLETSSNETSRIDHALGLAAGIEALAHDAVGLDDPMVDLYLALAYDSLRRLISEIELPRPVGGPCTASTRFL